MDHLMIDLETMGTRHDAPILAVGAVLFDPATGETGPQFYEAVDPTDALKHGRLSGDTLKWWMAQGDDARAAAMAGTWPLQLVLRHLTDFCASYGVAKVWGNGATFDITILECAYASVLDQDAPWKFWNVRDCRTIKELADGIVGETPKLVGTAHNALDDAIHQAGWVSAAWKALRPTVAVAT